MWIDSHAHLDCFIDENDLSGMLDRAREQAVTGIIAIGGSDRANQSALEAARAQTPIRAVLGYDRDEAEHKPDVDTLSGMLAEPVVVGVGETGLDYHYRAETAMQQCTLLEQMLDTACNARLPVVIHSRDAEEDTLSLLRSYVSRWSGPAAAPGVLHCFTGDMQFARALLDVGVMISFSGIITFKKADALRDVLKMVPDDRLLIETDAPYLAPAPYRGKRNEPTYLPHVGAVAASVRGCSVEHIARITTDNAQRLFTRSEEKKPCA